MASGWFMMICQMLPAHLPIHTLVTLTERDKSTSRLRDAWVAQSVRHLPSAQIMIPESWDPAPHWAPCSAGSRLLPLPLPLPLLVCSLSLYQNK